MDTEDVPNDMSNEGNKNMDDNSVNTTEVSKMNEALTSTDSVVREEIVEENMEVIPNNKKKSQNKNKSKAKGKIKEKEMIEQPQEIIVINKEENEKNVMD